MNHTPKSRYDWMTASTLKAFVFILFPLAIVGQALVAIDKIGKGMWKTDRLGIPNVVSQLCFLIAIGALTMCVRWGWKELRSRTSRETSIALIRRSHDIVLAKCMSAPTNAPWAFEDGFYPARMDLMESLKGEMTER